MSHRRLILPILVLALGAAGFAALMGLRREPARRPAEVVPPLVRVEAAVRSDARLNVRSHGEVTPGRESDLVAQIGGRIVEVAPALAAGGFFEEGQELARIDPRDYRIAVTQAEARVAQANVRLALEEKEARIAESDWASLGSGDEADPLVRREPQLAEARANLASAAAALERAQLDLSRSSIRAPFRGRVRVKHVDLGEFVAIGTPLARVYSTDFAEVRLAIPADQIAFVDLPLTFEDGGDAEPPLVELRAELGGRTYDWTGRVVRTEGVIDPSTRALYAVARVDDPYARGDDPDRPPLTVGLFVEAVISGRLASDVFVLPRAAVRENGRVLIVDGDDRLRFRPVGVLRLDGDRVIVNAGLEPGDLVCVSPLDIAVDGMQVRVERETKR